MLDSVRRQRKGAGMKSPCMNLQDLGYSREQAEIMLEALHGVDLRRKNKDQRKQIHGRNQIIRNLTRALQAFIVAETDLSYSSNRHPDETLNQFRRRWQEVDPVSWTLVRDAEAAINAGRTVRP